MTRDINGSLTTLSIDAMLTLMVVSMYE